MDRPKITVVTVTDRPEGLDRCYESLAAQTRTDWEWVVGLVTGGRWEPPAADRRIRIVIDDAVAQPGAAKRGAWSVALGEVILELDPGDELAPDGLAVVWDALGPDRRAVAAVGGTTRTPAFAPTPHNLSDPRYAPVRALAARRSAYDEIGGFQTCMFPKHDLLCRLHRHGALAELPPTVYVDNTSKVVRDVVAADASYDQELIPATVTWCRRTGMEIIDLGDPAGRPDGFATLPEVGGPRAQVATLDRGTPLADSSVGLIRAHDVLPRLPDKIAVFNELYRILCHGGILLTLTPSTDGRGAFQDPLQVAFYNENSFWYFIDGQARTFVPEIRCRFVASQLSTFYPTEWHEAHRISYVKATLVAIKEGSRQGGQLDS